MKPPITCCERDRWPRWRESPHPVPGTGQRPRVTPCGSSIAKVSETFWLWQHADATVRALKRQLKEQADVMAASSARQQRETSKLRSDLKNMRGSLETRLNALTNAFVAFVELDGIRTQLAAFPQQAEARRFAFQDLGVLLDGESPPQRPDVEGYWLPPAMAALRPDGSVDPDLAAVASQRDPGAAPVFLTIAQAALGAGSTVAAKLPGLLAPDEDGTWATWQLLVWGAVLHGAFGAAALATLQPTFQPLLPDAADWLEWAKTNAGTNNEGDVLDWVTGRLADLNPQEVPGETSRAPDAPGRPDFTMPDSDPSQDSSRRPASIPAAPVIEPEEAAPATSSLPGESGETAEPDAEEVGQALLIQVLQLRIRDGSEDERALLARAEVLEEQFNNPLGASEVPDEVPEKRHAVLDVLRQSALDDQVSRQDRRRLWVLFGEVFVPMAQDFLAEQRPAMPREQVLGYGDLTVDPNGVHDRSKVHALMRRYEAQDPHGLAVRGNGVMWAGVGLCLLAVVILVTSRSALALLLIIAGLGTAATGYFLLQDVKNQRLAIEASKRALDDKIEHTARVAADKYEKAISSHNRRQEWASRFLDVFRSVSAG